MHSACILFAAPNNRSACGRRSPGGTCARAHIGRARGSPQSLERDPIAPPVHLDDGDPAADGDHHAIPGRARPLG
jgi:hypothetical protein